MNIAVMTFTLRAPWVHSLKEKRMIVKSLILLVKILSLEFGNIRSQMIKRS